MISTSSIDQEELMATIYAMRQQEEIYIPDDYLQSMENNAGKKKHLMPLCQ